MDECKPLAAGAAAAALHLHPAIPATPSWSTAALLCPPQGALNAEPVSMVRTSKYILPRCSCRQCRSGQLTSRSNRTSFPGAYTPPLFEFKRFLWDRGCMWRMFDGCLRSFRGC